MAEVIVDSWNGHDINDGVDYTAVLTYSQGLPEIDIEVSLRTGAGVAISNIAYGQPHQLVVEITIENCDDQKALRTQLYQWFDPKDRTAKEFRITDTDGDNLRYIMAVCKTLKQVPGSKALKFAAILVVDGLGDKHYRYRAVTADTSTRTIAIDDATVLEDNDGEDETYPIFIVRPTLAKSTDWAYKRRVAVRWQSVYGATNYPIDLTGGGLDTATIVTAGHMQADGDDIRVRVNGVEVDHWLADMNTSATKIWVNLNFSVYPALTLATAIASSGDIETIDFNEAIHNLPTSGMLMIGTEEFSYTGKNDTLKRVTGVSRELNGSTMAAHSVSDAVWVIQHDIWILYGYPGLTARDVDDVMEPAFNLSTSENDSWDYDNFGEDDSAGKPGQWLSTSDTENSITYTADHGTEATPWDEIGIHLITNGLGPNQNGFWWLYNPCGISSVNFANGEKRAQSIRSELWGAFLYASPNGQPPNTEYAIPVPTVSNTWQSWSYSAALEEVSQYLYMSLTSYGVNEAYLEVDDVTLTLDSSAVPVCTVSAQQSNFTLDLLIEDINTGYGIQLNLLMYLNWYLHINTDEKTVLLSKTTSTANATNQFQARTLTGDRRLEWLPFARGSNSIRLYMPGNLGFQITIEFRKRFYT